MRNGFVSGIVTGSIIGATAGMYAASKMTPRQKRRFMRQGKKMLFGMLDGMGMF
ncbi:hypothetical protein [Caldisalinibacter kiritimatiensis]|uniref:Uncharacterized protein n=1 Tax=Caldisalinibacter kiritimatiensis TaxID=1304284 RepID=R1CMM9_9FIRM|nr:hypothetical protein [Caldisalinibacter kiritimatiensis]EOC99955.1 hypothetical protein L21TH_2000 [Caldisalinibacter kiritimatiensis]